VAKPLPAPPPGVNCGEVGEKAGDVGLYDGDVGETCIAGEVGE